MYIHDSNRLAATLTLRLDVLCAAWAPGCEILKSICPYAPPSTGNSAPTRPTIQSSHPKPRTDYPSLSAATLLRIRAMGVAIRSRRYSRDTPWARLHHDLRSHNIPEIWIQLISSHKTPLCREFPHCNALNMARGRGGKRFRTPRMCAGTDAIAYYGNPSPPGPVLLVP